jgi:hypothetical protein
MTADIFMAPFRKWLKPPALETPFSTIALPRPSILIISVFCSIFVITSGFVYCVVRNIPLTGYVRGRDGKAIVSWMEPGLSGQFLAEGIVAALSFSCSAASFICAFYILRKDPSEPLTALEETMRKFAFSAPIWCFLSYHIFSTKLGSFSVKFRI